MYQPKNGNKIKDGKRTITDYELLDFVASISVDKKIGAADYIMNAVLYKVGSEIGMTPSEFGLLDITPNERFELIRLIAIREGVSTSEFIRDAVITAAARDMQMSSSYLHEIFARSEPWAKPYC
jgi:hypothetical protein